MSSTDIPESPLAEVMEVLKKLPDSASWDEIEYALHIRRKIAEGQSAINRREYFSVDLSRAIRSRASDHGFE
jgi:hypothetical protein